MSMNLSDSSLAKIFHLLKESAPTEAFRFARTNKYIHYITLNSTEGKWIPCRKDLILERNWWGHDPFVGAGINLWNHRRREGYSLDRCMYHKKVSIKRKDIKVVEKLRGVIEEVSLKDKSFVMVQLNHFVIDSEFVDMMMEWTSVHTLYLHHCILRTTCQELVKMVGHLKPYTFFACHGYSRVKFDNLFLSLVEGSVCLQPLNVPGVYVCPDIDDQALTNWTYKLPNQILLRSLLTNITLNGIIKFVKDIIVRKKQELVEENADESDSEDDETVEYDIGYIKNEEHEVKIARNEFTEVEWKSKRDRLSMLPSRLYRITVPELKLKIYFRTFMKRYHKITREQALLKLGEYKRKRDIREAEREASISPDYRHFRRRGDLGGFDSDFEDEPHEIEQRDDEQDSCIDPNEGSEDSDHEDIVHILGETYQDWHDVKKKVSELAGQHYDKEDESYFIHSEDETDPEDNSANVDHS